MAFKLKYLKQKSTTPILNNQDDDDVSLKTDILDNMQRVQRSSYKLKEKENDLRFTTKYRFIKTSLLILAFVSYGLNFEIVGPTLEDLRVQMNVNYSRISFGLVLRNITYLVFSLLFGLVLNKVSQYSDLFMAISSLIVTLTNIFIPLTSSYLTSMIYYSFQGLAQSLYETCGNYITLNLWNGVSESPINAVHAGYGIGALLSIQLAKPFIAFKPDNSVNSSFTQSNNITNYSLKDTEINLIVPYWLCAFLALLLSLFFVIAQIFQNRNEKSYNKNRYTQLIPLTDDIEFDLVENEDPIKIVNITNLKTENYYYFYLILFLFIFVFIQGYMTVICRFMLTYLTLGPAKFQVEQFARAQTLFWLFFIMGRFIVSFLMFRLDINQSIFFFTITLAINFLVNFLFIIPVLTQYKVFFWISISMLGLISGPIIPTSLMLAKQLINFQPFVLSMFVACLAFGGIIFQQLTGALLDMQQLSFSWLILMDNINSSYIIPYVSCFASLLCFLFFLPVYLCSRRERNFKL